MKPEPIKYNEGDKYWEVTFQLPRTTENYDRTEEERIIEEIKSAFREAVNIRALRCSIYKESPRLSVSKQSDGYTIYNAKAESQVLPEDGGE